MDTVNIHEAKTHFSRLVERAEAGEEIIIARSGKPVARLVPICQPTERRVFGQMRGLITVSDDFDDPLPDELLAAFFTTARSYLSGELAHRPDFDRYDVSLLRC